MSALAFCFHPAFFGSQVFANFVCRYADSKLMQLAFAFHLQHRLDSFKRNRIVSNAVDPGAPLSLACPALRSFMPLTWVLLVPWGRLAAHAPSRKSASLATLQTPFLWAARHHGLPVFSDHLAH